MLLPSNHFLNWKPIRFIVYTVNYVVLSLFSFPAVYLATRETKITKYDIFTENHVSYPDIFKDDVLVIVLGSRNLDSYYSLIPAYRSVWAISHCINELGDFQHSEKTRGHDYV